MLKFHFKEKKFFSKGEVPTKYLDVGKYPTIEYLWIQKVDLLINCILSQYLALYLVDRVQVFNK